MDVAIFDELTDRTAIHSVKWDVAPGELPMWVADMDFATAPVVQEALARRLANGTFGYSDIPAAFGETVAAWWRERHGVSFDPTHVIYTSGVVPALSSIVRSLTNVAEKVLVQPPVYNIFYNSIVNNGRRVLESPLRYTDGRYSMDFDDLEAKLSDPLCTLMILCNPHNPTGNVWTREELARLGELCARHHVVVASDEIHCEIVRPGMGHVSFMAASETCRSLGVTCASPSKAFNTAGLHSAYVVVDNPLLRHRVVRGLNTDEVAEPNSFAIEATMAAYTGGAPWLDGLRAYIQGNKDVAAERIGREVPGVHVVPSNATYLLWLDCSRLLGDRRAADLAGVLRRETGLVLSDGAIYGAGGERFLRMNLGTQRVRVMDGLDRFARGCALFGCQG